MCPSQGHTAHQTPKVDTARLFPKATQERPAPRAAGRTGSEPRSSVPAQCSPFLPNAATLTGERETQQRILPLPTGPLIR